MRKIWRTLNQGHGVLNWCYKFSLNNCKQDVVSIADPDRRVKCVFLSIRTTGMDDSLHFFLKKMHENGGFTAAVPKFQGNFGTAEIHG